MRQIHSNQILCQVVHPTSKVSQGERRQNALSVVSQRVIKPSKMLHNRILPIHPIPHFRWYSNSSLIHNSLLFSFLAISLVLLNHPLISISVVSSLVDEAVSCMKALTGNQFSGCGWNRKLFTEKVAVRHAEWRTWCMGKCERVAMLLYIGFNRFHEC